jgi:hypothetical protein
VIRDSDPNGIPCPVPHQFGHVVGQGPGRTPDLAVSPEGTRRKSGLAPNYTLRDGSGPLRPPRSSPLVGGPLGAAVPHVVHQLLLSPPTANRPQLQLNRKTTTPRMQQLHQVFTEYLWIPNVIVVWVLLADTFIQSN